MKKTISIILSIPLVLCIRKLYEHVLSMRGKLLILFLTIMLLNGCSISSKNNYLGNYTQSEVHIRMKNANTLEIIMIDLIKGNEGIAVYVDVPIYIEDGLTFENNENIIKDLCVLPYYTMTGLGEEEYFVIRNEGIQMARIEGDRLILYLTYKVKTFDDDDYILFTKELFFKHEDTSGSFSLICDEYRISQ